MDGPFPLLITSASRSVGLVDDQHDLPAVGQHEPPAVVVVVARLGRPRGRRGGGRRPRAHGRRRRLGHDGGVAGDAALVVELLDLAEGIDVSVPASEVSEKLVGDIIAPHARGIIGFIRQEGVLIMPEARGHRPTSKAPRLIS